MFIGGIYISGPMTGLPENNYPAFMKAETELRSYGFYVMNPARVVMTKKNPTWDDYMKKDIKSLLKCSFVYFLPGWEQSKGARLERKIAMELGYKFFTDMKCVELYIKENKQ